MLARKAWHWLKANRYDSTALTIIIAAHTVLFVTFLSEPLGSDDCSYFEYAQGQKAGGPHHRQRFAHLASMWLAQRIFGFTELAYYAVPFAYGLGLLIALYALARRFMGPLPALIATLSVASMPDWLRELSFPLPDTPALFWFCVGLNFFLRGFAPDREGSRRGDAIAAATCFFLAVSAKETSVVLLPALLVQLLVVPRTKQLWQACAWLVGTMAALAIVEIAFCWMTFGDPLYRVHAVTGGHVKVMGKMSTQSSFLRQDVSWGYLATRFFDPKEHFFGDFFVKHEFWSVNYFTWFYGALSAAIVTLLALRKKDTFLLLAVVVAAATVLSLAVVSLDPLVPLIRNQPRYFIPVTALAPILIAVAVVSIGRRLQTRLPRAAYLTAAIACAVFALGFSGHYVKESTELPGLLRNGKHPARNAHKLIKKAAARVPVARVVGPKYLRSGRFAWPDLKVPIMAVPRGRTFDAFEPHDVWLVGDRFGYAADETLVHTDVGRKGNRLYWWARWDEPGLKIDAPLRVYGASLGKSARGRGAQLQVSLEFKVSNGSVRRVQVLELDRGGRQVSQHKLEVTRTDDRYSVEGSTPLTSRKASGLVVELVPKGHTQLTLTKRDIRVVQDQN